MSSTPAVPLPADLGSSGSSPASISVDDPFRIYFPVATYTRKPPRDVFSISGSGDSTLIWRPATQPRTAHPVHVYDASLTRSTVEQASEARQQLIPYTMQDTAVEPVDQLFEDGKAVRIMYFPMMDSYHLLQGQASKKPPT